MYREANLLLGDIVKVVCSFCICSIECKIKGFIRFALMQCRLHSRKMNL